MSKRAALYIRVSTEEQARHGLSLDAQLDDLKNYAAKHGYTIAGIYADEGYSARKKPFARREFRHLLNDVEAGLIDTVLFIKLDRWFRSVQDYYKAQEILDAHNVTWETTQEQYNTTTTNGRLMLNIKLSVAQNESDTTSDRIKFVFNSKLSRREVISGQMPLGYKTKNKHYVIDDDEAEIVRDMYEHFNVYHSVRDTLYYLQDKYNRSFTYQTIRRGLSNPMYTGLKYGDPHFAPSIIDTDLFNRTQELFKKKVYIKVPSSGRVYIFSGLLICPSCGAKLGGTHTLVHGSEYMQYHCNRHFIQKSCPNYRSYNQKKIEQALLSTLEFRLKNYAANLSIDNSPSVRSDEQEEALERKIKKLRDLYLSDLISRADYAADYTKYNKELEELRNAPPVKSPSIDPKVLEMAQNGEIITAYNKLTDKNKRAFWHSITDHIDLDKDRQPIIYFL